MHDELQMMVAKGNPKAIAAVGDLVRSAFLAGAAAQQACARFGFVKARPDELVLKPID
jgi:hypothetical protein